MTNSQKKQVLETWTNLKPKLSKLVYLNQNKVLIKESVESYLLTASALTSVHSNENFSDMPTDYQFTRLERLLNLPLSGQVDYEEKLKEWKKQQNMIKWNGFLLQKEKNEKIVKECKELLRELESI